MFDFYSRYHLVSPRSRCQTTASRAAARANAIKRAACAPQGGVFTDKLALSRPGHSYTRLSRLTAAAADTMMFSRALAAICLLAVAYAKPVARNMRVHERRADVPASFTPVGAAAPETMLKLRIQLAQSDIAGLEDALMAVSTPGNSLYGQHLTAEEVRASWGTSRPGTVH